MVASHSECVRKRRNVKKEWKAKNTNERMDALALLLYEKLPGYTSRFAITTSSTSCIAATVWLAIAGATLSPLTRCTRCSFFQSSLLFYSLSIKASSRYNEKAGSECVCV